MYWGPKTTLSFADSLSRRTAAICLSLQPWFIASKGHKTSSGRWLGWSVVRTLKGWGFDPGPGACLGCGFRLGGGGGARGKQPINVTVAHRCFSLSPSFISVNICSSGDFKTKRTQNKIGKGKGTGRSPEETRLELPSTRPHPRQSHGRCFFPPALSSDHTWNAVSQEAHESLRTQGLLGAGHLPPRVRIAGSGEESGCSVVSQMLI